MRRLTKSSKVLVWFCCLLSSFLALAESNFSEEFVEIEREKSPHVTAKGAEAALSAANVSSLSVNSSFSSHATAAQILIDSDSNESESSDSKDQESKLNVAQLIKDLHEYYNISVDHNEEKARVYRDNVNSSFTRLSSKPVTTWRGKARNVTLQFDFPFYGHPIRNITISARGVLFTGETKSRSELAEDNQYIKPLMANFTTNLLNNSFVKHFGDGKSFHVFWENVLPMNRSHDAPCTFSVSLYKDGSIVFGYYDVSTNVTIMENVKIGISDAFVIDETVDHIRELKVLQHSPIDIPIESVRSSTIIKLEPLPTCRNFLNCLACLKSEINFSCSWCPRLNSCANQIDRKRKDWQSAGCDQISNITACSAALPIDARKVAIKNEKKSSIDEINETIEKTSQLPEPNSSSAAEESDETRPTELPTIATPTTPMTVKQIVSTTLKPDTTSKKLFRKTLPPLAHETTSEQTDAISAHILPVTQSEPKDSIIGLITAICSIIAIASIIVYWVVYAYTRPHSTSGQFMIKYMRPWTWRRNQYEASVSMSDVDF